MNTIYYSLPPSDSLESQAHADLVRSAIEIANSLDSEREDNRTSEHGEVYHNAKCDGCNEVIRETRYKCPSCPNWDYCSRCHQAAWETHPMHKFKAYKDPTNFSPIIKLDLLPPGRKVMISTKMSYAEIMRRSMTISSPFQLGRQAMYIYTPLKSTRDFRLLALLPGCESTRIKCKVVHVTLNDKLSYEALSYCWGDQRTLQVITVEELGFYVTENLYHALHRLRFQTTIRYLWIDALCIDQIDKEEKGLQVRQMRDIFSKANSVIFWLGEASDDSDLAMDYVCGGQEKEESLCALEKLFQRPCWSRVWCVQELAVSKSPPVVICGSKVAAWDDLVVFCETLEQEPRVYPAPEYVRKSSAVRNIQNYALVRRSFQRGWPRLTLYLLMRLLGALRATDPRDLVYALLGLAKDADDFEVHYQQPAKQVFIRAAQHIIRTNRSLDILSIYTGIKNPCYDPPLPTWVPDWTTEFNMRPPVILKSDIYRASGYSEAFVEFTGDLIEPVGLYVDRIHQVSEMILFTDDLDNLKSTIETLIDMLKAWIRNELEEPRETAKFRQILELDPDPRASDAFWRTLLCNQVFRTGSSGMMPASAEFANMFEILMYGHDREPPRDHVSGLDFEPKPPRLQGPASRVPDDFEPDLPLAERIEQYICPLKIALMIMSRRRFFITKEGRMGMATYNVEPDDMVTILYGGKTPFLLRDKDSMDPVELVGECYVYGLMEDNFHKTEQANPAKSEETNLGKTEKAVEEAYKNLYKAEHAVLLLFTPQTRAILGEATNKSIEAKAELKRLQGTAALGQLTASGAQCLQTSISSRLSSIDAELARLQSTLGNSKGAPKDMITGVDKDTKAIIKAKAESSGASEDPASADVWTNIAFTVNSKKDTKASSESSSSGTFKAESRSWFHSVSAERSYSENEKTVNNALASCTISGSFSAMLVNIKRPWLHADLYQDFDIDLPNGNWLSPGAKTIKHWVETGTEMLDGKLRRDYGKFPAYPTAFIVAASAEFEIKSNETNVQEAYKVLQSDTSVSANIGCWGWGTSGGASNKKSDKSSSQNMEMKDGVLKMSFQAPQIVGWVCEILPELPRGDNPKIGGLNGSPMMGFRGSF